MKAVVLTGYGDYSKLELREDFPRPECGPYDVLVQVKAAGVNNTDLNFRLGWYSQGEEEEGLLWSGETSVKFPHIQGADVSGVVFDIGERIDRRRIGEKVIIEPCFEGEHPKYMGSDVNGGFAEFVAVPSKHAYSVNSDLSFVELASFPCSYSTAENLLQRACVCSKDRILVTGASGGVGSAIVQLAVQLGAEVIAIASSAQKSSQLTKLGASRVISRDENLVKALSPNSIDCVVDLVGGNKWADLLQVVKPRGRYAVSGAIGGAMVQMDLRLLYLKDLTMFGCTVLDDRVFQSLVRKIETRAVKPLVAATYALSDIVEAQKRFLKKDFVGKIVLDNEKWSIDAVDDSATTK